MHPAVDRKDYQMLPQSWLSEARSLMYFKYAPLYQRMHSLTEFIARLSGKPRKQSAGAGFAISPDAIASAHPNGLVFLHIGRGEVFNSNRIGARIWRALVDQEPLGAVTAGIAREYGVEQEQVERDAKEFLTDLEAQGFLTRGASF